MSVICDKCSKTFTLKRNLVRHQKTCDGTFSSKSNSIKCPECLESCIFSSLNSLKRHIEDVHEIKFRETQLQFKNIAEFQKWKEEYEKEHSCWYVVRTTNKSENEKQSYLRCHRSGFFQSKSTGVRKIKSQGSNKIDSTCPSSMTVYENENGVYVTFCETHFGHGSNLGRCRLTNEERTMIAGKIANGVSLESILDQIRDNVRSIYDVQTLTTKRTLLNIRRDYELNEGQNHQSDYLSVCLWIQKHLLDEHNPILYHEIKEDDVFLVIANEFQIEMLKRFGAQKICIDSTHGTNEYEFQVTTIVVVDEFSNGFPAAFCITKKKDTETWKKFFEVVKNSLSVDKLNSEIFMSDDDPAFYSAWKDVMGAVNRKLLCSWHVDQSWRRNIQSKITDTGSLEKKSLVYKTLKILHQEPDRSKFETLLSSFISELMADKDTAPFGIYFRSYYMNRVEEWAYCYRHGAGINTNMYLEAIHKNIKYYYLRAKKNRRLDKCLNALMKYIRDQMFARFIKLVKNSYTLKDDRITSSHKKAKDSLDKMEILITSPTSWSVKSLTSKLSEELSYDVTQIKEICDVPDCKMMCRQCNICTHLYICDCPDHTLRLNICKHIHACMLKKESASNILEQDVLELNNNYESFEKALVCADVPMHEEEKQSIMLSLNTTMGFLSSNEYSSEEYRNFKRKADTLLLAVARKQKKVVEVKNNEPSNKKIEKQKRFVKKKKEKTEKINAFLKETEIGAIRKAAETQKLNPTKEHFVVCKKPKN